MKKLFVIFGALFLFTLFPAQTQAVPPVVGPALWECQTFRPGPGMKKVKVALRARGYSAMEAARACIAAQICGPVRQAPYPWQVSCVRNIRCFRVE